MSPSGGPASRRAPDREGAEGLMRKVVAAGTLALLVTTACGGVQDPAPGADEGSEASASEASTGFGHEEIGIGESLAQIRGHHLVGLELMEVDEDAALAHFNHPIEEILDVVGTELDEHGGSSEDLEVALQDTLEVAETGDLEELEASVDETEAVIREAEAELLGPDATSPAYRGSVVAALLSTAAHEYEEAVAGGEGVSLPVEYEDAYGFASFAHDTYDAELAPAVEEEDPEEAEEIEEAFEVLEGALPGAEAPAEVVDAEEVEVAAELVGHELEETVGAQPLEEVEPAEVADNIESLLAEVVEAYEAGDTDEAAELAAEAYLENYEVIEAEVIEYAPEINEQLEPLLGAELRRQIDAGAPVEEIRTMVEDAEALLAEALTVLEEEEEEHS